MSGKAGGNAKLPLAPDVLPAANGTGTGGKPANVRIFNIFFHPDHSAVSQLMSDVAFHLAGAGHRVEVMTSRATYNGNGRLGKKDRVRGVEIRRVWGPSLGKGNNLTRLADQLVYSLGATLRGFLARRADTVVVLTDPPFYPAVAALMGRLRRERVVMVLMDVFPDIPVRSGLLLPGSPIHRIWRRITRWALARSDHVIVLGRCMRDVALAYGVQEERITIIHNWADESKIRPLAPDENPFRAAHGLEDAFVVLYSGNMGVLHRFETVLEAARRLRRRKDIVFVFIGDGARRQEIESFRARHSLDSIRILPYQPRHTLPHTLSAGDVHFVSLRGGFEGLSVPSKAYGILAAGRPTIFEGPAESEIAMMLSETGAGALVREGDVDGLVSALLSYRDDPDRRERSGKAARAAAERSFSMGEALRRYEAVIAGVDIGPMPG